MKTYLNFSVVVILFFALPFMQCTKDGSLFNSTEEKILGQWRFEKVTFFPHFSLSGDDQTLDFQNKVLDFRKDQSVLKHNTETAEEWEGTWRLGHHISYDANATGQTVERLDAMLVHTTDQTIFPLYLDNLHVTHKKVRSTEYVDGGRFEIRLVRL